MKSKKYILIFFISAMGFLTLAFSQDEITYHIQKCARLESGFATHFLSAEDNNKIIPGLALQYCYGIKTATKLGLGLGAGFQFFEKETFVPFFMDAVYFLSKGQYASFINVEGGYALGWSKNFSDYNNSLFKGGPHVGFCYGKKIVKFNQMVLYLSAKYVHQFASVKYEMDQHQEQKKSLHYNMFILSLGFMLDELSY
jgi:hypothetical protein